MFSVRSLIKLLFFGLFVGLAGLLIYKMGLKYGFRMKRMIKSQRVYFDPQDDKIKYTELKNGMKVIVYKSDLKPKVLMRLCYNVGSASERSDERGLAHLVEHMIFKGTGSLSETDINAITRKYGVATNASTSYDYTSYYFESDKENWRPFLGIMADCMKNARFDDQALASELKTVVAELNRGRDNFTRSMFLKAIELLFPANHPYHFPVIGFKEELAHVSGPMIKDFYNRYYHPNNAVLFIIGDIDLEEVTKVVQEKFESIPKFEGDVSSLSPKFPAFLQNIEEINHTVYHDVSREQVCYFWPLPGAKVLDGEKIEIANMILGGDHNSVLYSALVDEEGVADSVSSGCLLIKEAGMAYVMIKPKLGKAADCERVLKHQLKELSQVGVSQEVVASQIPRLAKEFIQDQQDFKDLSYSWMRQYFERGRVGEYFNFVDELYAVQAEDINKIFKTYLQGDLLNKISLKPLPEEKKELWAQNNRAILKDEEGILRNHVRTAPIEEPRLVDSLPEPKLFDFKIPEPTSEMEINGVRVLFYHDTQLPLTHFVMKSKNSEYNRFAMNGDEILMAELLIEGSAGYTKKDHLCFFEAMGASHHFAPDKISCSVLDANFAPVLDRMFYVLQNPTFRKSAFEKVREILIGNAEQMKRDPARIASDYYNRCIFKNTEFDFGVDELIAQFKSLTIRDIVAAHGRINPSSWVIGVAGSFDVEKVKGLLYDFTADWKADESFEPKRLPRPNPDNLKNIDLPLLRDQAFFSLQAPSELTITSEEYPAMILASYIAFVGFDCRMFKVREQTGLFYASSGSFSTPAGLHFSDNYVKTLLSPGKLVEGEGAITKMLDGLVKKGITEDELRGAKRNYFNNMIDAYSNSRQAIGTLLNYAKRDLPIDFPKIIWGKIQECTVEQVNAALRKNFSVEKLCRIRVGAGFEVEAKK